MQPTTAKPPKVRQGSAVYDEMAADFHGNPIPPVCPTSEMPFVPTHLAADPLIRHLWKVLPFCFDTSGTLLPCRCQSEPIKLFFPPPLFFFRAVCIARPLPAASWITPSQSRSAVHRSTVVSPDPQPTIIIRQCFSPSSSTTRVIQGKALPVSN